jgi:PIN domain nuclease of toxin-antitoxin system
LREQQAPARGYLLDTQAAIFTMTQSSSLSATARAAIAEGPNVLSVVSFWEVMIKSMKGKLEVDDPRAWWFDALDQLAATPLLLHPRHIAAVHSLPPIRKDPFDRILIAQATVEGLALVTMDAEIAQYASQTLRVIG